MRLFTLTLLVTASAAPGRAADPPKVDLTKGVTFTGTAAATVVTVRPRVSGYLERVAVKEGDAVKKGDVLFEVDARPYRAKLDAAKAELAVANAQAKAAASELARVKEAIQKGIVAKADVERAEASAEETRARTDAAKAVVALAELNLGYTKPPAPIDGKVARVTATAGELVSPDETAVVTVVALDPIAVTFEVDEGTALAIRRAVLDGGKPAVAIGLGDEKDYPRAAALDAIAPQVDPKAGTVRFRAVLPNPKELIPHGAFVRVKLTVQPGK